MTAGALVDAGADPSVIIRTLEGPGMGASFEFAKVKRRLPAMLKMIEAPGAPSPPLSISAKRKPPCVR